MLQVLKTRYNGHFSTSPGKTIIDVRVYIILVESKNLTRFQPIPGVQKKVKRLIDHRTKGFCRLIDHRTKGFC